MPLKTFRNLTPERRKEIIQLCLAEFARNDYNGASLSRIIRKLNLAKGSFYRYFESKEALYFYLLEFARDLLHQQIERNLRDTEIDFFDAWVNFSIDTVRLEREYPHYFAFVSGFSREKLQAYYGVGGTERQEMRLQLAVDILEPFRNKGRIRQDVSIEILGFTLLGLRRALRDYLAHKYEIDLGSTDRIDLSGISEEQLRADIEGFTAVLRGALIPPEDR